jgi:hypothetical protein
MRISSPNYSNAVKDIIRYADSNETQLKQPIIIFKNFEFRFYLKDKYTNFILEGDTFNLDEAKFHEGIKDGGTLIFINIPPVSQSSTFWKDINWCKKVHVYNDGQQDIGYVYTY